MFTGFCKSHFYLNCIIDYCKATTDGKCVEGSKREVARCCPEVNARAYTYTPDP